MAIRKRFNVVDQDDAMQDIVSSYTTNSTYGYFQVCKLFSELDTEYKKRIKSLEEQNESYKSYIITLNHEIEMAENDVRDIVANLIGRKIF